MQLTLGAIAPPLAAMRSVPDGRDQERVAIAYEQAGDWRNAARLWQELLQQQPTVSRYLVGALRSLKMLGNEDAMLSLFEASSEQARSWDALAYYGYALMRRGKPDAANSAWDQALLRVSTEQHYRLIAGLQIEAGAPAMAAKTYQAARSRLGKPALFAEELAQLAIVARDRSTALEEILTYFEATQNLSRTQGLIATLLTGDNDQRSATIERIGSYARRNASSVLALRLYEWALREVGDYQSALDVVTAIERQTGNTGRELYTFAERARMEGAFGVALVAYGKLMDIAKQSDLRTMALYGYVQTLEQQTLQQSTPSVEQCERIIAEYERIINEYPNSGAAVNAMLRIAELERDWGSDPERALSRYNALLSRYPNTEQAARARLERLPLLARRYGIDSVSTIAEQERPAIAAYPALVSQAQFIGAEFNFFRCRFESAIELYRQVASNTESSLANDAIERLTLITINRSDSLALCQLAQAERLFYQLDFTGGLAMMDTLGQGESDLSEYALMRAGSIALERSNYDAVAHFFGELIVRFPETIYADRALWGLATAARALGDRQKALELYNQLLSRYPNSIYVPRVRLLIRSLRGDS